jgi:predicted RNase H-like nuclease (RuvC/YqgF family)
MDMTDEEGKKELFDLISKDKELESVLKTKYGKSEEESVQMAINMAEENKEVKSKFKILFSEERKAFEDSIEAKDKEILNLKEQLEETPNDTKVKAEIKMSARNTESTMEALNRITKNNN